MLLTQCAPPSLDSDEIGAAEQDLSLPPTLTQDEWIDVLELSIMWCFDDVCVYNFCYFLIHDVPIIDTCKGHRKPRGGIVGSVQNNQAC